MHLTDSLLIIVFLHLFDQRCGKACQSLSYFYDAMSSSYLKIGIISKRFFSLYLKAIRELLHQSHIQIDSSDLNQWSNLFSFLKVQPSDVHLSNVRDPAVFHSLILPLHSIHVLQMTCFYFDILSPSSDVFLSQLYELDLGASLLTDRDLSYLINAMGSFRTLSKLLLNNNRITNEGAQELSRMLLGNRLKELNISSNLIGPSGSRHISKCLRVNSSLQILQLQGNHIDDTGVEFICSSLEVNQSLSSLNLGDTSTGDDGATAIGRALSLNHTLSSLYLYRNSVGVVGSKALAEGLLMNSSLKLLNLGWNNIGDDGLKALGSALESNKSLAHLNLERNHLTVQGGEVLGRVSLESFKK
ncbi:hypothetical protein GEMRC1_004409 [Eukaryota sp. GEM-RC1]